MTKTEYNRAWRARNRDHVRATARKNYAKSPKLREYRKNYAQEHRAMYRDAMRKRRKNHPEECKIVNKLWIKRNREKARASRRAWYAKNRARELLRAAKWRKENPDRCKIHRQRWEKKAQEKILQWKLKSYGPDVPLHYMFRSLDELSGYEKEIMVDHATPLTILMEKENEDRT